jgi:preprotein translocase subunit SecA
MRHYDVQLVGGMVLHQGKISEMRTGEGKTLVATLPVYLNALAGTRRARGHRQRLPRAPRRRVDGPDLPFLGLSVGCIQHDLTTSERQEAYRCRHHLRHQQRVRLRLPPGQHEVRLESMVQRGHHYAIVDEVDSILVDEARTPLIISGPSEESTDKYYVIDRIIPRLERGEEIDEGDRKYTTGDFLVDEKAHTVALTDEGVAKVEKLSGSRTSTTREHGVPPRRQPGDCARTTSTSATSST